MKDYKIKLLKYIKVCLRKKKKISNSIVVNHTKTYKKVKNKIMLSMESVLQFHGYSRESQFVPFFYQLFFSKIATSATNKKDVKVSSCIFSAVLLK